MSLQYIIDGYNLTNHRLFTTTNSGRKIKDSRIALLELIRVKRLCGSPRNSVTIVFDGYPDSESLEGFDTAMQVVFARQESADERIRRLVEKSGNPKNIRVVSDDKEIKFFVKAQGAKALSVEEFLGSDKKFIAAKEKEPLKPELTYTQTHKINQELKKLWRIS